MDVPASQSLTNPSPAPRAWTPTPGERELVQAARCSPDAFSELYRQNYGAIERYIRRRVGDEHLAGDLVAETFLGALDKLSGYQDRGLPFRAWLYAIASSQVSRWARRRKPEQLASREPLADHRQSEDSSQAAAIQRVRMALLALPARYQDPLALYYIEELSVRQVAQTLGARVGTIKARLARGRKRLRLALAPHQEELFNETL